MRRSKMGVVAMTKQDPTPMSDDDDFDYLDEPAKCKEAQLADALVDLSRAVDLSRNEEARAVLIKAMIDLGLKLSTPRGELKAIKK